MIANYVCRVVPAYKRRSIRVPVLSEFTAQKIRAVLAVVDGDDRLLFDEETGTVRIMNNGCAWNDKHEHYDENGLMGALMDAVGEEQRIIEEDVPETTHNEWQFVPSLRVSDLTDIVNLRLTNHTRLSKIPLPRIGDLAVLESGVCLNMCLRFSVAEMDLEPGSSANVRILRFDAATRRILSAALPPHGSPPAEPCASGFSEPC